MVLTQFFCFGGLQWLDDGSEMREVGGYNGGAAVEGADAGGEVGGCFGGFEGVGGLEGLGEVFEGGGAGHFGFVVVVVVPGEAWAASGVGWALVREGWTEHS